MKRVKYMGLITGETRFVGVMEPGEIVEVEDKIAEILLRGNFELVKGRRKKVIKKAAVKPAEDCDKCPKNDKEE